MKKITLLTCCICCSLSIRAVAGNTEMFYLDENAVNDKFRGLTQLENFVEQHEGISLTEINAPGNLLLANIHANDAKSIPGTLSRGDSDLPLGIPALTWGMCFGVIGWAIVNASTNDNDQKAKVFWGCAVNTVVLAGISCVVYIYEFLRTWD